MTYADGYNIRTTFVKFNDVGDAIDGVMSRVWGGSTSGTVNALTVSPSPAWTSYDSGAMIAISPHGNNTGNTTLNVNGLGTKTIIYNGQYLVGGELQQSVGALLIYNGTYFELYNHCAGMVNFSPTFAAGGSMTYGTTTTRFAVYQRLGKLVRGAINVTGTTGGTASDYISFTIPHVMTNYGGHMAISGKIIDNGTLAAGVFEFQDNASTCRVYRYDGANWGLGSGREFACNFWYTTPT